LQARIQLRPEPRSAAEARHWVRDRLTHMGRDDLVDSAEAGVSELVTNGILHAQTSIGLQVTRDDDRVIIEVYDNSPMVYQPSGDPTSAAAMDSTIGRGLRIVRAHAREWGVSTSEHGKAIWFLPTTTGAAPARPVSPAVTDAFEDVEEDVDLDAALEALADAFPDLGADEPHATGPAAGDPGAVVKVRMLGVPGDVVRHYRKRWLELVREMQLVALAPPSPQQQMAQRLSRAAQEVQPYLYLVEHTSHDERPIGLDDGAPVDGEVAVPRSLRDTFVEIRELAREMEREWAGIQLLFVHPGKQAVRLREWWLGEIIGQLEGAEPTSWPGDLEVRDEAALEARDESALARGRSRGDA
jgi:anti-sigma regulatory factor (Ser/Thr protein kinase)